VICLTLNRVIHTKKIPTTKMITPGVASVMLVDRPKAEAVHDVCPATPPSPRATPGQCMLGQETGPSPPTPPPLPSHTSPSPSASSPVLPPRADAARTSRRNRLWSPSSHSDSDRLDDFGGGGADDVAPSTPRWVPRPDIFALIRRKSVSWMSTRGLRAHLGLGQSVPASDKSVRAATHWVFDTSMVCLKTWHCLSEVRNAISDASRPLPIRTMPSIGASRVGSISHQPCSR
jgi:hypothetical protein